MHKLLFIGMLVFCTSQTLAQTIRRVNNNPLGNSSPLVYATAQAAIDASVDGDVIYLEPTGDFQTGVNYGPMNITKRLTIYGNGYFLNRGNPNLPFDKRPVSVDGITLGDGSAFSSLVGIACNNGITMLDSNITISRCLVGGAGIYFSGTTTPILKNLANNCTVIGCYVGNFEADSYGAAPYATGKNTTCKNNIITGRVTNFRNSSFTNNVFSTDGYTTQGYTFTTLENSVAKNNIIDARRNTGSYEFVSSVNSSGNTITNNVCVGYSGLPAGSGNINAANPTTTFTVQDPFPQLVSGTSNEQSLKIPNSSVAKTAGEGSTEAGAFGGSTPYVPSGIPPVPLVTSYSNNASAHTNASLTFTIGVKSTN